MCVYPGHIYIIFMCIRNTHIYIIYMYPAGRRRATHQPSGVFVSVGLLRLPGCSLRGWWPPRRPAKPSKTQQPARRPAAIYHPFCRNQCWR